MKSIPNISSISIVTFDDSFEPGPSGHEAFLGDDILLIPILANII